MPASTSTLMSVLARALTRKTSGRKLIPEIDGLRSVAILSVVFFHANANFAYHTTPAADASLLDKALAVLLSTGEFGVPLFFAISGFILATPFAARYLDGTPRPQMGKYFIRRLTRLEPPYVFCLVVLAARQAIAAGAFTSDHTRLGEIARHLLAHVFYLHSAAYGQQGLVLPVAWSLEVEVQFYVLAPLLCTVFALPPIVRRSLLVGAALLTSWFFGVEKPILGPTILHQFPYFAVGLLLADFYLTSLRHETRRSVYWDAAALASLAGVFGFKAAGLAPALTAPWLILAAYVAVFRGAVVRRFFAATPVVILGGMCYTIYLWHFAIIAAYRNLFFHFVEPTASLPLRVVYVLTASVVAVAISAVLFALIERPTMDPRWPQKLVSGVRGLAARAVRRAT